MLTGIRTLLYRAINTERGDFFPPIRFQKRVARRVNRMLGSPLKPAEKTVPSVAPTTPEREPAPVMVYFEKDRNVRELTRIQEALRARNIAYKLLDVIGDDATKSFVVQAAQCEEDDLPIVFVAGEVVGPYNELVQWDVSGRLMNAVFGPPRA